MDKNGNITISNPQKGIANSSILGNEAIIGCEIFEEPGVLKIQSALEADSSDINDPGYMTISGVPVADVTNYNTVGELVRTVLTESGQLMSGGNANFLIASNLSQGWDACVWNSSYTVVSYAQSGTGYIGVIYHDPTDENTTNWNPAEVGSLTGTHAIKLLKGADGKMYFTNGRYIGYIENITGTGSSITVTSTSNALDLKEGVFAVTMAELGSRLMIGTQQGYSYATRQDYQGADIYPWDRTSSSFSLPVKIDENGMNAMISHRNQVYFSAGDDGRIYTTDGTNYQLVKRLPYNRSGRYNPTSWAYLNAMAINQQGHLMVGLSANYDANSPTTTGVWEVALTSGYPTHLPFFSRDGNLGQTANVKFGSVRVLNDDALSFGVASGTSYELSTTSATALNTGYTAKWRTEFFMVGSRNNRKSFNILEFTLLEPLIANQGIRIAYRKNRSESFTTIGTFTFATLGSVISHNTKALIADAEMVQFEISLEYTSAVFGDNVNLIRITVN
jgi:hypothetical protein